LNQGKAFKGNNNVSHSLTFSNYYKWNGIQFSLGWKFRTGIPYTLATGVNTENQNPTINYATQNGETLPDYHRLDFSVLYEFNLSKKDDRFIGKVGASLLNVYNRNNLLKRSFLLNEVIDENSNSSFEIRQIDQFSLGTTPNIIFRLQF
ncbi:unnamed protein product, partial [Ectocarpus sp. 4 AP-2014]